MAENFCSNCGKPLLQDDKFCSGCGKSTVRIAPPAPTAPATPYYDSNIRQPQPQYVQQVRPDRKNPGIAALASLIIVGIGHFYVGKWWRGLAFMVAAIVLFWGTIWMFGFGVVAVWIAAPIDAYNQAKKHNLKYGYPEGSSQSIKQTVQTLPERVKRLSIGDEARVVFGALMIAGGALGFLISLINGELTTETMLGVIMLIVIGIAPIYVVFRD